MPSAPLPSPQAQPAQEPVVLKDAPERIYLVIDDDEGREPVTSYRDYDREHGKYADGIHWCEDRINSADIPYVRADLASPQPAPSPSQEVLAPDPYEQGLRDMEDELSSVLPGVTYMDPPDGGAPTILEQLRRQAKDAARYRWLTAHQICRPTLWDAGVAFLANLFSDKNEVSKQELDAAIDAAISAGKTIPAAKEQT